MDNLIIGILFLLGNAVWSIAFLFYQSYTKKKGENAAVKEDSKEIAMLAELGKNMATKSDIHEITLIAERAKNEATKELAQSISYEDEKGKNLATKEDSRVIAYEQKKGEILATKQDLDKITDAVESIKDSYNKSLEKHKIELQKDFESYKYRAKLCNSIDEQLIDLIYNALKNYFDEEIPNWCSNDINLISYCVKISIFLDAYGPRYNNIKQFKELKEIANTIKIDDEINGVEILSPQHKKTLIDSLNSSITIFLPPFNIDNPDQ